MSVPSITSGNGSASSLPEETKKSRSGSSTFEGGESSRSGSTENPARQLSLRIRVEEQKKIELQQKGKELVNLEMLSDDLQVDPDLPVDSSISGGMKAVMVTRSEDKPQDFDVELLRVQSDGSTETLFRTDSPVSLQGDSGDKPGFRGSLLDTRR